MFELKFQEQYCNINYCNAYCNISQAYLLNCGPDQNRREKKQMILPSVFVVIQITTLLSREYAVFPMIL